MVNRFRVWVVLLLIAGGALAAEPGQTSDWKTLAKLYHARRVPNVMVLNGCELRIEGIRCRLLGIRLRPGESNRQDAKRFVERFLQYNGSVLRIANARELVEGKDGTPLVWIESGYGAMLQRNMAQAGLATIDEAGLGDFTLYHESYDADTRRSAFDWKKVLRSAEADFKAGKRVLLGFPWPLPVQTDEEVCSAVTSRLGKPDETYAIAGRTYLDYRFAKGATLTLTVHRGSVTDILQDGGWRSHSDLTSEIEARLGKPQGEIKIDDRVMLDYNLDNGKTLSLIACDGSIVGVNYGWTKELRGLVGLKLTIEGKVRSTGKPGPLVDTHRGGIYFLGGGNQTVYHFDAHRVRITGVLKYRPPYPGPLPWPPAQLACQVYYFDAKTCQIKEVSGREVSDARKGH